MTPQLSKPDLDLYLKMLDKAEIRFYSMDLEVRAQNHALLNKMGWEAILRHSVGVLDNN